MIVPIGLCIVGGIYLDRWVKTGSIMTFIFIVLGIGAAYRNAYLLVKQFTKGVNEKDANKGQ